MRLAFGKPIPLAQKAGPLLGGKGVGGFVQTLACAEINGREIAFEETGLPFAKVHERLRQFRAEGGAGFRSQAGAFCKSGFEAEGGEVFRGARGAHVLNSVQAEPVDMGAKGLEVRVIRGRWRPFQGGRAE